ncbi:MAG: hypothetical protein ACLFVO_29135, partial [Chloroflexaceae bacterium]
MQRSSAAWDAGRGILPGTHDPAEAGTPERRYPDETCNVHQPRGMLAGASCRERMIRLKPGLLNGDIRMKHATFIS